WAVETSDYLPPLGCACPLRLWRASVHILSANFMASRRAARRIAALEIGSRSVGICGPHTLRMLAVSVGPPLSRPPGWHFCSCFVCCQPLFAWYYLFVQCLRSFAGWFV